ncbi:MAG: arginine--tRNA ligase [bacterium]|nr:arginine--tRNA ligase [bacterium]
MNNNQSCKQGTLCSVINDALLLAFQTSGYTDIVPHAVRSKAPITADYQCNDAFALAKISNTSPLTIATQVAVELQKDPIFSLVEAVQPGFINMNLSDEFLADHLNTHTFDAVADKAETIVLDFGGANIAKPLHVGHLRSAIIGESLKRIAVHLGHTVIGDIHLGDWGLQMGMLIEELKRQKPDLPYFDSAYTGPYPKEAPITISDLDEFYPAASKRAKEDEDAMIAARKATVELQQGRPGYRALWQHIVNVSIADLKRDYRDLGVTFDLWLGESDAHDTVVSIVKKLLKDGLARKSEGAIIIDVAESSDSKELPPLMLINSEGAELYGATDLATIVMRMKMKKRPDRIVYVVDKRQNLHLDQVFRAARKAEIVGKNIGLEHIGFGTMNGTDNKPFKTRAGGIMKLKDLLVIIQNQAQERIREVERLSAYNEEQRQKIASLVGQATLKFADLSNYREHDYVFDVERFSAFEGYTGPYILYNAVRAGAILEKVAEHDLAKGKFMPPTAAIEREIYITLNEFGDAVSTAWNERSPSVLCEYAYRLANSFSSFYSECPVLIEKDEKLRYSRITIVKHVRKTLEQTLLLLGIEIPERM